MLIIIRAVKTALLIFTEFVFCFLFFVSFSAPTHAFSTLVHEPWDLGPQNLVWWCSLLLSNNILNIKVIGQRSGSLSARK